MSAPLRASEHPEPHLHSPSVALVRASITREARILIIDDHQANIEALKRILRSAGFVSVNSTTDPMIGVVLVQTYSPDHPAIIAACKHDYTSFSEQELIQREQFGYPPYASLARIIMRGPVQRDAEEFADGIVKKIQLEISRTSAQVRVLGPAPPPIAKLRGHYRFHAMLISKDPGALNTILSRVQSETKATGDNLYLIDIDPVDML